MQKVQLLIATMNQIPGDYSLLKKMNVQSNAIVCNQCNRFSYERLDMNGLTVDWYCFNEKGVGLNRNNALMRASDDIVVFCDDDMAFIDGYQEKIIQGFKDCPKADVLIFNIGGRKLNRSVSKVSKFNYLNYGAARIAARLSVIRENGILFNLCFGGGSEHQHGEDNIFLHDCLEKGLNIYTFPVLIAELIDDRPSTWRTSYEKKYFLDQGALYRQISRKNWKFYCLAHSIRHRKMFACSWYEAYKIMISMGKKNAEQRVIFKQTKE